MALVEKSAEKQDEDGKIAISSEFIGADMRNLRNIGTANPNKKDARGHGQRGNNFFTLDQKEKANERQKLWERQLNSHEDPS